MGATGARTPRVTLGCRASPPEPGSLEEMLPKEAPEELRPGDGSGEGIEGGQNACQSSFDQRQLCARPGLPRFKCSSRGVVPFRSNRFKGPEVHPSELLDG